MTAVQRAKYNQRVQQLAMHDRGGQMLSIVPGVAALGLVPVWIALQKHVPIPMHLAAQVCFSLFVTAYTVWIIRWKHRRHGPRALRETGMANICPRCAYDLSAQPEPEGRCPECGEAFIRFHPDRTWSTDRS